MKKLHLFEDGNEFLDPEFIRSRLEPLTENVLKIEKGNLSFSDKAITNGLKVIPSFVNNYSSPYFNLMIEEFPDEMINLNVEGYSLMREKIKNQNLAFSNFTTIIEVTTNDLKSKENLLNSISKIITKNKPDFVSFKLIREGRSLTLEQIRTLYKVLKKINEMKVNLISQNLGIEGTIISWVIGIHHISRGVFSERINRRKKIEQSDSPSTPNTSFGPPSYRLYDPNTFHFRKNVDCNCDQCKIRLLKKKGTILPASAGPNLNTLVKESSDMLSHSDKNRKNLIILKLEEAIRECDRLKISDYHSTKLKRTLEIIDKG